MIKLLLTLLALSVPLCAQIVTVVNHSNTRYEGWIRTSVAQRPPHLTGWLLNQNNEFQLSYAVGHLDDEGLWAVDLRVAMMPNERRTVDLATLRPVSRVVPQLPQDISNYFQGMPHVNGVQLIPTRVVFGRGNVHPQWHDGAGFTSHISAFINDDLMVKFIVTWYPDQPGWCRGRVVVSPIRSHRIAANGLNMSWGNAFIIPYNGAIGQLLPPSHQLIAGVDLEVFVTVAWWDRVPASSIESFIADAQYQVIVKSM